MIRIALLLAAILLALPACAEEAAAPHEALKDPSKATETAPDRFYVEFDTTKGSFVVEVNREWAPNGADRFYNLVKIGFYEDVAFFRVIPNFMAQFGIHGDPAVASAWKKAGIPDDPVKKSNEKGFLTYAKSRTPNSRTTQLFINLRSNRQLDRQGFAPFGKVVENMSVVEAIYKVGKGRPGAAAPAQQRVQKQGNAYLRKAFPDLDYVKSIEIVEKPGS